MVYTPYIWGVCLEIRKAEYQEVVGIISHLEESLAFITPSPEGGPIEGRLLTLISALSKNDADTKEKDVEITRKDVEIKHVRHFNVPCYLVLCSCKQSFEIHFDPRVMYIVCK